ncbi:hypothetical protein EDD15DRAFT_2376192 [Pisolithus albus]|nr:hypothetical protein EDD15DRAFT_2376192 [Pisolithus albus]
MPLNLNGKIDIPTLPFPDTPYAHASAVGRKSAKGDKDLTASPTEQKLCAIWSNILPNPLDSIPLDESFFDLDGHSILATRLIFEIRKQVVVQVPLGVVFSQPTVSGLASTIDVLRDPDFGIARHKNLPTAAVEYGKDVDTPLRRLRSSYPPLSPEFVTGTVTICLTGATGVPGCICPS